MHSLLCSSYMTNNEHHASLKEAWESKVGGKKMHIWIFCDTKKRFYLEWRPVTSASTITCSTAVNVITHGERARKERMKVMKDCRWKTREEVTEWEDREAAQLAPAQRIHFVGPQISQCYVSQNPQFVFARRKQQRALTVLERDQSGWPCKWTHPLERTWENVLLFNSLKSHV